MSALLAATTWPDVGLALVTLLPSLAAAYYAARASDHARNANEQARKANEALETPSKTTIGKQVEDALQTTIANNFRLQAMTAGEDAAMPEKAAEVERRVLVENDVKTRAQRAASG